MTNNISTLTRDAGGLHYGQTHHARCTAFLEHKDYGAVADIIDQYVADGRRGTLPTVLLQQTLPVTGSALRYTCSDALHVKPEGAVGYMKLMKALLTHEFTLNNKKLVTEGREFYLVWGAVAAAKIHADAALKDDTQNAVNDEAFDNQQRHIEESKQALLLMRDMAPAFKMPPKTFKADLRDAVRAQCKLLIALAPAEFLKVTAEIADTKDSLANSFNPVRAEIINQALGYAAGIVGEPNRLSLPLKKSSVDISEHLAPLSPSHIKMMGVNLVMRHREHRMRKFGLGPN